MSCFDVKIIDPDINTIEIQTCIGEQPSSIDIVTYDNTALVEVSHCIALLPSDISELIPVQDIVAGSGISVSSISGIYTISSNNSDPVNLLETVQDIIGNSGLLAGNYININYNDNTGFTTISATGLQPSGNYSVVGHTHTASNITDFNSAVSGLLPVTNISAGSGIGIVSSSGDFTVSVTGTFGLTGEQVDDRVSELLVAGSYINLNYNDNLNSLTISTTGLQPSGNYANAIHTHTSSDITDFNSSVSGLLPVKNILGSGYVNVSSNVGNYTISVSGLQPSGNYSIVGHTHTSSDITNFNSSVSGLLPVKDILAGSGISVSSSSGIYTINADISGVITEVIQDNLGSGFLVAGTGVQLTYDDPANTLRLDNLHTEINELSLEPQGFVNRLDSIISFNDSTRTFTIAPSGASYDIYIEGIKVTKTTSESIVIPTGTALNYLHFDTDTGLLSNKTTSFNFDTDVPIAYIHWNSDINQSTFFGEERHGIRMDSMTHKWIHNTFGMQYINGLSIGGYTLLGNGSSNSHAQINISDGTLYQEDIIINIADGNNGVEFTQQLSPIAYIPVYYHLGSTGQWVRDVSTPYPLKYNATRALYNLYSGGTWTTPNVPNNRYFAMWIVATNDINDPVLAIMGQREDSSLSSAENNNIWSDVNLTNIPTNEIRPLYRLIFVTNDTFANTPKSSLQSILDLRKSIITSTYGVSQNDHGNLFGLGDDDHAQYIHINEARTVSANHTFNNGLTISSGLLSATSGNFTNINVSGAFELTNTDSTICPFILNIPNQNDDIGALTIVGNDPDIFLDSTAAGSGYPISITYLQNGQFKTAAGYNPWANTYFISRFNGINWNDTAFNVDLSNGNVGIGTAYPNYTLDVAGSGNFLSLYVNGTSVSVSGHSHTTSNITDFNSSVSGLLPSVTGTGYITSSFNSNIYTIGVSGLQPSGNYSIVGHAHTASDITDFNSSVSGLFPSNIVTGVGSSGYLTKWTGANSVSSGIIYDDGTNIGIGTSTPSGLLDVAGNLTFNTFTEKVITNTNSGSGVVLSIDSGTVHRITLTNNCTFTMPSVVAGKSFSMFLNTGSGNYTASFSGVLWSDSAPPTITTTANKVDILSFISDGSYWYGSCSQNYG